MPRLANQLPAILVALVLSLSLSGCARAPTDEDLRAAMTARMEQAGGKMGVEMFKDQLTKVKLIACKKADLGGYQCDWNGPMGPGSGRLVKSDEGWVLIGV